MGRITIFAIEDCPHCQRAKAALAERGIPFTEISLTTHPQRRTDMIRLCDRLSVPQIFINERHIGGADETLQLLHDEHWTCEKYQHEIASQPDPVDPRLRQTSSDDDDPPVMIIPEPLPRDESDDVVLPTSTKSGSSTIPTTTATMSVLELVQKLKSILPGTRHKVGLLKVHNHCFTAADGVDALSQEFSLLQDDDGDDDDNKAMEFGNELMNRKIIQPVGGGSGGNHSFHRSDSSYFRLQCYHTCHILNSYRIWNTRVDADDPMGVLNRLKKLLGKVESAVTNNTKGEVDYKQAIHNEHFPAFEEAVCELQGIDMKELHYYTKLAFGINLYNLMIKYSFMKVGIYNDALGLLAYFNAIKFNIGGHLFSFHDLESGILRANRPAPYSPFAQFGKKDDPRLAIAIPENQVDCRIHFGLNCGAKSCPPVKNFTAEGIEEELRIVAMAFCEDDNNVQVDTKHSTLSLSQIINWYRIDFAPTNKDLPKQIVEFLRGNKKEQLQAMIDKGKKIKIKFKPYDWTTNASDFVPFRKRNIQSDATSICGLC